MTTGRFGSRLILGACAFTLTAAVLNGSGCQRISVSTRSLGLIEREPDASDVSFNTARWSPLADAGAGQFRDDEGATYTRSATGGSGRATVTTIADAAPSGSPGAVRSVLSFVELENGGTGLSTVERPRDDLELRFTPPLEVLPPELDAGVPHVHTTRATATRASGKDAGTGDATVTTTLSTVTHPRTSEPAVAVTMELRVQFGFANWSRTSVRVFEIGTDSGWNSETAQEQLRVLGVLVRDTTLTSVGGLD